MVKLTPLKTWEERGRFGAVKAYRVTNKDIKIKYAEYLGMPYDLAFKFNNGKMYCSELVYEIYKKQFGIEICKPKKLKEYNTLGIRDVAKNRGMNLNQLVVAPSDLFSGMKKVK